RKGLEINGLNLTVIGPNQAVNSIPTKHSSKNIAFAIPSALPKVPIPATTDLWHRRLSHASQETLGHFPTDIGWD
ncbi:hypothetical protein AJ78_06972, partial [Emergomyces pasteurianus Ep9510]